jgi:hypothetical protein
MSSLDILAVVSVVVALVGSMLAAAGASWNTRAYFAIVAMLFDIIFTVEFFSRLASGERPWLIGIGSVLPLMAVSGPFLFGWAAADMGASAVRGFWLAGPPASALTVVGALRILRVGRTLGPRGSAPRLTPILAAFIAACAVLLVGAIALQETLLPGPALADKERQQTALASIAETTTENGRLAAAKAAGVMALRVHGLVILPVDHVVSPADYVAVRLGTVEAWFLATAQIRSRGALEAILALAGLAAAAAYHVVARIRLDSRANRNPHDPYGDEQRPDSHSGRPDTPAGVEELAGILGKRPR